MALWNRDPQLSPEATAVVDQLVDIAHDEGDPLASGIEWFEEEPPLAALAELEAAGLCVVEREGESVRVAFTRRGARRFA
ncbi:hypothetical protein [Nocardioides litoris]|uniref:hypothetical protein n=1 Tax=Nocardioides litoris TaxID=1926648 RepID=UPI0011208145|nr:hypothetical protein [Nocardioides litoris]